MSLFIRCEWLPSQGSSLEECITDAADLFSDPVITRIIGVQWYSLGRSKAEALSNSINLHEISRIDRWRQVRLTRTVILHCIDLWNGQDYPRGINVSVAIQMPPSDVNKFLVSSIDSGSLRSSGVSWKRILFFTKRLADRLGGLAVVSSHDVLNLAKDRRMKSRGHAAYAAFWGVDRSQNSPRYYTLKNRRAELPFSYVVCGCWEELKNPDAERLEEMTTLLEDESKQRYPQKQAKE